MYAEPGAMQHRAHRALDGVALGGRQSIGWAALPMQDPWHFIIRHASRASSLAAIQKASYQPTTILKAGMLYGRYTEHMLEKRCAK
jgi:hypothetical protein